MKSGLSAFLLLLMVSAFTIFPGIVRGEEEAREDKNKTSTKASALDDLVVSATRTEKDVDSAPGNSTVITRKDLDARNIHTLQDALIHEVGIFNGQLRGLSGQQYTLVMLNGMPLNNGWRGLIKWENIAIDNVKRIEIIRGPASALYGGNAMGGVINIITDSPKQLEAVAKIGYGSDETLHHSVSLGNRFMDKLNLRLGYEMEESDGYAKDLVTRSISSGEGTLTGGYATLDTSGTSKWAVGDKGDEYYDRWNINLDAVLDLTDTGTLSFNFQWGSREYGFDHPDTYLVDAAGNPAYDGSVDAGDGQAADVSLANYITTGPGASETPSYLLTYQEIFGAVGLSAKVGYHHEYQWYVTPLVGEGETYDNADGFIKEFDSDVWFSDIQTNISIGDNHLLTSGVSFRYDGFDGGRYELTYYRDEDSKTGPRSDITEGKDRLYALYLQDEWQFLDSLSLFIGARLDYWETYDGKAVIGDEIKTFDQRDDSAINPKISAVWRPLADTVIKGSVGRAFRPPSLYELYRNYRMGNGTVNSNPNLDPETLINYELGVAQYFFKRSLKVSATAFHQDISDLIYYYKVGNDRFKENASEATIDGFELEASLTPFDWLNVWGNYTYNDSEIKENVHDPEMEGKRITYMPESTINLGTDITYRFLTLGLMGRYLGRIYTQTNNDDIDDVYGGYSKCWLWEGKLTLSPFDHVAISFSVDNLFDEEYFENKLGRERSYFAEVSINW